MTCGRSRWWHEWSEERAVRLGQEDGLRLRPVLQPVFLPVPPAVDAEGDLVEAGLVADVGESIETMLVPEPARGEGGMRRERQLFGTGHHGGLGDGLRVGEIIGATSDLDQPAAPEAPPVPAGLIPVAVAVRVGVIR